MAAAVECAAQPATVLERIDPKDACPLPPTGSASPGDPDRKTCSGVMQCVHVDTLSGAFSVKSNEPIPELSEGDVLIKASCVGVGVVFSTKVTITTQSGALTVCMHVCACVSALVHCCHVQVSCAGVNRLDLLQAAGKYPPPPGESDILGVEGSYHTVTVLEPHTMLHATHALLHPSPFPLITLLPTIQCQGLSLIYPLRLQRRVGSKRVTLSLHWWEVADMQV